MQGQQECGKRPRFPWPRRRDGSNFALEPRNDTPGPREPRAGNPDDYRRRNWQRQAGRQDRKPALLVAMKLDRDSAPGDPDRQRVAEPPDGVVPSVSHLRRAQAGQVRSLFFEQGGYEPFVNIRRGFFPSWPHHPRTESTRHSGERQTTARAAGAASDAVTDPWVLRRNGPATGGGRRPGVTRRRCAPAEPDPVTDEIRESGQVQSDG
jgi:hypothetical protein